MNTTLKAVALAMLGSAALAQGGPPPGRGPGQPDMRTIHALFADTKKVTRGVKEIPGGIESWTDSKDPKVVRLIQEHVAAMKGRLERHEPIRMWDPLFKVLFEHADQVRMRIENTKTGVRIVETSDDPYVVKLIRAHAAAVSGFVHEGMAGMPRVHPAPSRADTVSGLWDAANAPYKRALQATTGMDAAAARRLLDGFRAAWDAYVRDRESAPPTPFAADPRWRDDLAAVTAWGVSADASLRAGDLHAAHETLEQVRLRWLEMRSRNGVDFFGDHLTRYHEPMERVALAVKGKGPATLAAADIAQMRAALPELRRLWKPVAAARPVGLTPEQAARRKALVARESEAIEALARALASGDPKRIAPAAAALKPRFAALYLAFG